MAVASFCVPVWSGAGAGGGAGGLGEGGGGQAYFRRVLLSVKKTGADKTVLCFRRPNLESILYIKLFRFSLIFFLFLSLSLVFFREELAMRLDLTEARVQVSGSLFLPVLSACNGEGNGFMSSIKWPPAHGL